MGLPVGTRIGPYEILSPAGTGGMGEVYKARDSRLDRIVALKRIRPERLDEQSRARFDHEARAIAALNHPNICTLYDLSEHDTGTFLVMEYLQGETLADRLRRGALPVDELLGYASQIADALDRAHRRGIVHRDLKPGNIILTQSGAKLLDFGLARRTAIASDDGTENRGLTAEGHIVGTVAYMAPEQLRGFDVDARTDLFAFGAILYEGLTCARAVGAGSGKLPSASDLRPDAPAELVRLIERCLAEKPDDRWQSAHDVMLRLREIEQASARGTPVAPPPQARRWRRVIIPVAIAMTIAAAVGAMFVVKQSAPPVQSLAILPLHNASRNAGADYLGDGISDSIIANLSQLPSLRVVPRSLSIRFKGRAPDPREVSRNLNARAILTGDVAERGDTIAITVELFDAQENSRLWGKQYVRKFTDIFAVQEEIARDVSENLRLKLTPDDKRKLRRRYTEDSEAYRLYLQGQFLALRFPDTDPKEAIPLFERAIQQDPSFAPAYAGLARCYIALGYFGGLPRDEADPKAKMYAERALALDDSLAEAHVVSAHILARNEKEREAAFRRALALDPEHADAHFWYGLSLTMQGRTEEAESHFRKAVSLGYPADESMWVTLYQRDCARVFLEAPKALARNPGPSFSPVIHIKFAECLERAGRTTEAVDHYVRGLLDPQDARKALEAFDKGGMKAFWRAQHEVVYEHVSRGEPVTAYTRAYYEPKTGNREGAIEWLTRMVDARQESNAIWINADSAWDPLRDDPRFQALVRRMGYEVPVAR